MNPRVKPQDLEATDPLLSLRALQDLPLFDMWISRLSCRSFPTRVNASFPKVNCFYLGSSFSLPRKGTAFKICSNRDQGGNENTTLMLVCNERFEMRLPESAAERTSTASLHHTGIKHRKIQKSNHKRGGFLTPWSNITTTLWL